MSAPRFFYVLSSFAWSVAVLSIVVLSVRFMPSAARADVEWLDSVVAIVDGDVIMRSEFLERLSSVKLSLRAVSGNVALPSEERLRGELIERMIVESIQLQKGKRLGVLISDESLNESLKQLAARNNMSFTQFRQALELQHGGYLYARAQLRNDLILNRVQIAALRERIKISDSEVENYLKSSRGRAAVQASYQIAHVLLPISSDARESEQAEARAFMRRLIERARRGVPLLQLAAEEKAERFGVRGSQLDWRRLDDLPDFFIEAVKDASQGAVLGPLSSPSGLHALFLQGVRGGDQHFVDQTLARHLLIADSDLRTKDQSQREVRRLHQLITEGKANLSDLARQYSEDRASASQGGDLGWVQAGQMSPEFEKHLNETEAGAISKPFRSRFGWHIAEVIERRKWNIARDMRVRQAREALYQERYQSVLEDWLAEIRAQAYVKILRSPEELR